MAATVITFCSAKGGSGKTAISISIASLIAECGKKVLLIDADAATNGMTLLLLRNLIENKKEHNIGGLYDEEISAPIKIRDNLFFIPSSSKMKTDRYIDSRLLKNRVSQITNSYANQYDVIIFDTEAGIEESTKYTTLTSQRIVIVTEFDPLSASGVERLKAAFCDLWPSVNTYILVNKMLPEFANIQNEYFSAWNHLPPIPFDFEVVRSYSRAEIPWNMEELGSYTKSIARMTYELLPEHRKSINNWFNEKSKEYKQPIEIEYKTIEEEVEILTEELAEQRAEIKRGAPVLLKRIERNIFYVSIGFSAVFIVFGAFSYVLAELNTLSLIYLGIGFGLLMLTAGYINFKKYRQRETNTLKEEIMLIKERQLEVKLEELLQKKSQIESILTSDIKNPFSQRHNTNE